MAKIKTRDVVKGTIKTIDKAAIASERMKSAYISTKEQSASEFASDKYQSAVEDMTYEGAHQVQKQGKKALQAAKNVRKTTKKVSRSVRKKSIKTAERTSKVAIKTSKQTAKLVQKTAQASIKAVQVAMQAAKAAIKLAVAAAKVAVKAAIAAIKAIAAGIKALVAFIAAGGWVAVVIILVVCMVALLLSSVFGIFFTGEETNTGTGTGQTLQTAIQEINTQYENRLLEIQNGTAHDELEMSESRAAWKEVLAIYAVAVNTDPTNPQEVVTMDDTKKQLLTNIFWEMHTVSSQTEEKTETQMVETDDGNGNVVQKEVTVTKTCLYITVSHKTVEEMAQQHSFTQEQKDYLTELLKEENNALWDTVVQGIESAG